MIRMTVDDDDDDDNKDDDDDDDFDDMMLKNCFHILNMVTPLMGNSVCTSREKLCN